MLLNLNLIISSPFNRVNNSRSDISCFREVVMLLLPTWVFIRRSDIWPQYNWCVCCVSQNEKVCHLWEPSILKKLSRAHFGVTGICFGETLEKERTQPLFVTQGKNNQLLFEIQVNVVHDKKMLSSPPATACTNSILKRRIQLLN